MADRINTPPNRIVRTPQAPGRRLTGGIFDQLLLTGVHKGIIPAKTLEARDWYRKKALKITDTNQTALMREEQKRLQKAPVRVGDMVMYVYDPKWKKKLPYYDTFPLIFMIEKLKDGWLGINFHYLPPVYRAKLMDALYALASDRRYNDTTRLMISYKILKSASRYKWFRPCVHRYLASHVTSRFLRIHSSEWDIALFLPVANFKKASQSKVWQDSLAKVNANVTKAKKRVKQEQSAIANLGKMTKKK